MVIDYLPPSNPTRPFPKNPFKPLWENLKLVFHSRPLALAVLGIAFFIFMVAYMRATVYMHGETRNPKWDEFKTSLIVATGSTPVGLPIPGIDLPGVVTSDGAFLLAEVPRRIVIIGASAVGAATASGARLSRMGRRLFLDLPATVAVILREHGVRHIEEDHPDVHIVVASIDSHLNEKGFIVPGLGDAGDRLYGTK